MAKETMRLLPCRAPTPSGTAGTGTTTTGHSLPPEMVDRAIRQLGAAGMIYACSYAVMYAVHFFAHRNDPAALASLPFFTICLGVAVAFGLAIFFLARSNWLSPALMLDLGLVFEVAAALLISISESCQPLPADYEIRGVSSVAIWVVFFSLVVPTTLGKASLASFTTAAMGPLGMAMNIVVTGNPVPTLAQWLVLYVPPFLMAFWSVTLSRYVYNLGKQAGTAAEMGSYELVELIGRGGMGEVWKAKHRLLARRAAIKLIRSEALNYDSPKAIQAVRKRFELEAQATAALHSPHTVELYDYGVTEDGTFYYVMEYLDGLDLELLIERFGPQPPERVIHLMRQICESLAEAHAYGLTHRDIKPKNIYLCRLGLRYDFAKVLDFGLVKTREATEHTRLTREGVTTGTPAFMSPEMAQGKENVDARTDVYAVGCVGYWLLTGQLVFEASTALAMALAHIQTEPLAPSHRTETEVPADLERVIMQCLRKRPDDRPASARELDRLLASCEDSLRWRNEQAEEWWTMHLPNRAHCGLTACPEPSMDTIERVAAMPGTQA